MTGAKTNPGEQVAAVTATGPVIAPKKLIEVALPLDAINAACAREKAIRHGHPSTLHLWWARRPLAAARAVIFAQAVNDPSWKWELEHPGETPPNHLKASWAARRKQLFGVLKDLVLWENSTNDAVLQRARDEIIKSWKETCEVNKDHPEAGRLFDASTLPPLHDPFAGGGAIPLEAQRLGFEALASDLNPVAVLINKAMIEVLPRFANLSPVCSSREDVTSKTGARQGRLLARQWRGAQGIAEDVRFYGEWMHDEAHKRLGHLFPRVRVTPEMVVDRPDLESVAGKELTVLAWIWARTVRSPNPAFAHVHVPLVSSFVLSSKKGKGAYVLPVVDGDRYVFMVRLGDPPRGSNMGTRASGSGAQFRDILSDAAISPDYIRTEGQNGRIGQRLMAIVTEGKGTRIFLPPCKEAEEIAKSATPGWRPETKFFQQALGFRVGNYGMTAWCDLFTPRQLAALGAFSELVSLAREKIIADATRSGWRSAESSPPQSDGSSTIAYADAVAIFLSFGVSRSSDYWSNLCIWRSDPKNLGIGHVFSKQTLSMVWDFAEANPFSSSSGNWRLNLGWIVKVLEQSQPALVPGRAWLADARSPNAPGSALVSTDPPYYDNVGYADLSDFFYCWLRPTLRPLLPDLFATVAVPKEEELVATPARHGGKQRAEAMFLHGMTEVLRDIGERAHPAAGPVTVYYAFKQADTSNAAGGVGSTGWETFLEAVIRAGFMIAGTWPLRTELGNRTRSMGSNALASSIVLVCRRRDHGAPTVSRRAFLRELDRILPDALDEMTRGAGDDQSPVAPVDLSQAIIGPGMAIFSKYSSVLEADGSPMTVRAALQLVNRFLAEDDFDADTQFCLHWFEQQGWSAGQFGAADVLARAKGTAVDGVKQAGVVESGGGKVRLLRWADYSAEWDPERDLRLPVWEVLHQLIRVLKSEGEASAGRVLASVATRAEAARQLAYRLYTLCERKGWAEDARAYNELITSWSALESAAAKAAPSQRELFED